MYASLQESNPKRKQKIPPKFPQFTKSETAMLHSACFLELIKDQHETAKP
jgi:hypothetical protein